MTVERDPRATTAQQCSKGLILLEKQTAYLSKALILHAHEIGTFCIDCTGTPESAPPVRAVVPCPGPGLCVSYRRRGAASDGAIRACARALPAFAHSSVVWSLASRP